MSPESKLTVDAFAGLLQPIEAPAPEPAAELVEETPVPPVVAEPPVSKPRKVARAKKHDAGAAEATPTAETPDSADVPGGGGATPSSNPYRPVNISLPVSILKRYEAYKKSTGVGPDGKPRKEDSHSEILFDAIDATVDQLPELIHARYGESKSTSLFNRPNRKTVTFAPEEGSSMFIVRVRKDNADILDDLYHRLGAPNRNAMIVVAYDAFLPKTNTN